VHYISLSAVQWLHDIEAGIIQIGKNHEIIMASTKPGYDHPALRRAQALAAYTDTGVHIMRGLLKDKIKGQIEVLRTFNRVQQVELASNVANQIEKCAQLDELRLIEAKIAGIYWDALNNLTLTFAQKDRSKIPVHWLTFGQRNSHLNNGPRNASTPGNAMLNYLYAILESETRIAVITQGMDPGLGILHTDQPSSNGLVYDVMEPVRPFVDKLLLQIISKQVFTRKDFIETERGEVRLSFAIRRLLTQHGPAISKAVSPYVELVALTLIRQHANNLSIPTILTQNNRKNGREGYRVNNRASCDTIAVTINRCQNCGSPLGDSQRSYCDNCWPETKTEHALDFVNTGPVALQNMRNNGQDPAHNSQAKAKRSESQKKWAAQRAGWNGDTESARKSFLSDVQPKLANVSVSQISKATGLSLRYASLIRQGKVVPHPVHFEKLSQLVNT